MATPQADKKDTVLDSSFLVEPDDVNDQDAAPEQEATTEQQAEPQKTTLSRREKARQRDEAILSEMKALREAQEKRDAEHLERIEAIRRENAELRGHVSALSQQPRHEPKRDEAPDPAKLEREAVEALDRKDFATYQRKTIEAAKAAARADIFADPRFAQPAQPGPQVNPMLMATASQYGDVMGNPEAFAVAQAHDAALAQQGVPPGPERWKRGFERGREYMNLGKKPAPTFSKRNAEVLAAAPTSGEGARGAGGGERGVILTEAERAMAKRFKMPEKEYAQHLAAMHPERVVE